MKPLNQFCSLTLLLGAMVTTPIFAADVDGYALGNKLPALEDLVEMQW